ncbi:MAG: hypothetical protein AAF845_20610 [Bacteroidota bacterium]
MYILTLVGAGILTLLGVAHGILTLRSSPSGGPLTPEDEGVRAAMSVVGGLGLEPSIRTTLWKAWVGFNLSHSLGVVAIGALIGIPVLQRGGLPLDDPFWMTVALAAPWLYLVISIRYWFKQPTHAIGLASALITASVLIDLAL